MRRHVGNPVSGDQFWPRPDIIDPMVESIVRRGESHKLFGLRRIGKSSVMKECGRLLEKQGCIVVHVNAEDFGGCDSLFVGLLGAIKDHSLQTRLVHIFEQNKTLPSGLLDIAKAMLKPGVTASPLESSQSIRTYWPSLARLIGIAIRESDKRVVLFLDELPFMLQNMLANGAVRQELENLLAGLRAWRQEDGLVMVLAGSLGLSWLMRQQQLPSVLFNNLNSLILPPLEKDNAQAMLNAILTEEPTTWWKKKTTAALLQELEKHALYPIFVQTAFDKIKQDHAATPEAIARVFREKIEPDLVSNFYKQFNDRLKRYDTTTQSAAHAVFDGLFSDVLKLDPVFDLLSTVAGVDPDECMEILEEDGFIAIDRYGQTLKFTSPLVGSWWRSYRPRLARRRAP